MKKIYFIIIILITASIFSCYPFTAVTPEGFVKLRQYKKPYQAVSTKNMPIVVEYRRNKPYAPLDFWTASIKTNLIDIRGYTYVEDEEFQTNEGISGLKMSLETGFRGDIYYYIIAVIVTKNYIYEIQFGCPKSQFDEYRDRIDTFIKTIKVS